MKLEIQYDLEINTEYEGLIALMAAQHGYVQNDEQTQIEFVQNIIKTDTKQYIMNKVKSVFDWYYGVSGTEAKNNACVALDQTANCSVTITP